MNGRLGGAIGVSAEDCLLVDRGRALVDVVVPCGESARARSCYLSVARACHPTAESWSMIRHASASLPIDSSVRPVTASAGQPVSDEELYTQQGKGKGREETEDVTPCSVRSTWYLNSRGSMAALRSRATVMTPSAPERGFSTCAFRMLTLLPARLMDITGCGSFRLDQRKCR